MNTIDFILAVHNHQPVGNFDFVVEEAYRNAYRPFLEVLSRHPAVKIALHNSGCLLDWIQDRHPEYLDNLASLVERAQVEVLTGGYYEPILSSIPEADREGQIRKLTRWLRERFGTEPTGLWLTERVWEPSLAGSLARSGVRYTMTDDTHFLAAGVQPDRLWGHYLTEDQGEGVHVFPISKRLRYLIPFREPEETIEFLRGLAQEEPGRVAVLGDDGEKFGVWPGTHKLVYRENWLDRFFALLEQNQDWLRMRFPGEVIEDRPPLGKTYLPTASYDEMMEWALPPEAQKRYRRFREQVERNGRADAVFIRGGFWRNFFARYPESDHINKRMLRVRREALALGEDAAADRERALDLLWSAQCNCAYWHGVFGGLYLPHLREALYERILEAETVVERAGHGDADWSDAERVDFDADGDREVFLRNPELTLVLAPGEGGALQDLSAKQVRAALGNGLTRRPEAYHERIQHAGEAGDGGTRSIHDLLVAKEQGLEAFLHYDRYRRGSLQDHFLRSDTTIESFLAGNYGEEGDFLTGSYEAAIARSDGGQVASLRRTGSVWVQGEARRITVEKRVRLNGRGASFQVDYEIRNEEDREAWLWFAMEWNLAMMAGNSPDHRYRIPGVPEEASALASVGETKEATAASLVDGHRGFSVDLEWSEPATLWRMPVETVSLSESGFERIYQSSTLLPNWRLRLPAGESRRFTLRLAVKEL